MSCEICYLLEQLKSLDDDQVAHPGPQEKGLRLRAYRLGPMCCFLLSLENMGKKKKKGSRKQPPTATPKKGATLADRTDASNAQEPASSEVLHTLEQEAAQTFLSKDYPKAVNANTRIIALAFSKPALLPKLYKVFTERGVSNLYLQHFAQAVEDCCSALALQPRCLKAYVTRAFANFYLQRFTQAFEDYELARLILLTISKLQPANVKLQRNLTAARKALTELLEQFTRDTVKSRSSPDSRKLEWLGDFGLLAIPYQDEDDDLNIRVSARAPEKDSLWRTEGSTQLPFLIPVGDSASEILPFLNVKAVANKVAVAMKEKDQGNSAYAVGEYPKAMTHYTRAIKLNPRFGSHNLSEPIFYSNRGLVYLKMQRYYDSIGDCTASLERKPSIKAFARRAAAWAALKEYFLAAG